MYFLTIHCVRNPFDLGQAASDNLQRACHDNVAKILQTAALPPQKHQ